MVDIPGYAKIGETMGSEHAIYGELIRVFDGCTWSDDSNCLAVYDDSLGIKLSDIQRKFPRKYYLEVMNISAFYGEIFSYECCSRCPMGIWRKTGHLSGYAG